MEILRLDVLSFTDLNRLLQPLIEESKAEGFNMLQRLADDFESSQNRFDKPGEALFACLIERAIVGVGGLNVDPYRDDPLISRVRRVYVSTAYRRRGIGRALVQAIVEHALTGRFSELTLRTDDEPASAFYESLGFQRIVDGDHTIHRLGLS